MLVTLKYFCTWNVRSCYILRLNNIFLELNTFLGLRNYVKPAENHDLTNALACCLGLGLTRRVAWQRGSDTVQIRSG